MLRIRLWNSTPQNASIETYSCIPASIKFDLRVSPIKTAFKMKNQIQLLYRLVISKIEKINILGRHAITVDQNEPATLVDTTRAVDPVSAFKCYLSSAFVLFGAVTSLFLQCSEMFQAQLLFLGSFLCVERSQSVFAGFSEKLDRALFSALKRLFSRFVSAVAYYSGQSDRIYSMYDDYYSSVTQIEQFSLTFLVYYFGTLAAKSVARRLWVPLPVKILLFFFTMELLSQFWLDIRVAFVNISEKVISFRIWFVIVMMMVASLKPKLPMTFGSNKSKYKLRGEFKVIQVTHFDRSFNYRLLEKEGQGKGNFPLRRLRGCTSVSVDGSLVLFDYPVMNVPELRRAYDRGVDLHTLRHIDLLTYAELKLLSSRYRATFSVGNWFLIFPFTVLYLWFFKELCGRGDLSLLDDLDRFWLTEPIWAVVLTFAHAYWCAGFTGLLQTTFPARWDYFRTFLCALCEELNKSLIPWLLPSLELFHRIMDVGFVSDLDIYMPFLIHLAICDLPFGERVGLHMAYNLGVFDCGIPHRRASFELTSVLESYYSSPADVMMKLGQLLKSYLDRDLPNFVLTLVNCRFDVLLTKFFSGMCKNYEDVVAMFFSWNDVAQVQLTGVSQILLSFSKILPRKFSSSKTLTAAIALVSCVITSMAFGSYHYLEKFLPLVSFENLGDGDVFSSAIDASVVLVKSIISAVKSRDFRQFFIQPDVYVHRHKTLTLLERRITNDEELSAFVVDRDALREEVCYSKDSVAVGWMLKLDEKIQSYKSEKSKADKLREAALLCNSPTPSSLADFDAAIRRCRELGADPDVFKISSLSTSLRAKSEYLTKCRGTFEDRIPPMGIFMLGPPGTGKTTFMNQIRGMFGSVRGKEIDRAEVGVLNLDDKYSASTVNENAVVLEANDATADHSQDKQQDRVTFGTTLQIIFDSVPLTFRDAEISKKGLCRNKVELVFMTSNERSFSTSESTERLQRRFDEYVIAFDMSVVGDDDLPVGADVFQQWTDEKRSSRTRMRIMTAVCSGKTFSFTVPRSSYWCHPNDVLKFIHQRFLYKPIREAAKLRTIKQVCPVCKILKFYHYDHNGEFSPIDPRCQPFDRDSVEQAEPPCSCGLARGHDQLRAWEHGLDEQARNHLIATATVMPRPRYAGGKGRLGRRDDSDVISLQSGDSSWTSSAWWLVTNGFWTFVVFCVVSKVFSLLSRAAVLLEELSGQASSLMDMIQSVVVHNVARWEWLIGETNAVRLRCYERYLNCKIFAHRYRYYVLGLATSVIAYRMMKPRDPELTGVPMRDNTVMSSLEIDSHHWQKNYTPEVAEKWKRDVQPMEAIVLKTKGCRDRDLKAKVTSNTLVVDFQAGDGPVMTGHVLVLNASYVLVNRHYFLNKGILVRTRMVFRGRPCVVGVCDCFPITGTELLVVKNPYPSCYASLIDYFADEVDVKQIPILHCGDGCEYNAVLEDGDLTHITNGWKGHIWYVKKEGQPGTCGQSVIAKTVNGGSFILGTVSFAVKPTMFSGATQGGCVVTRKSLVEAMSRDIEPSITQITRESDVSRFVSLTSFSSYRSHPCDHIGVIGTNPDTNKGTFRSSFKKSSFHDFISELKVFKKEYGVITSVGKMVDGVWVSGYGHVVKSMAAPGAIPSDLVTQSVDQYVEYILSGVEREQGPDMLLSPLTLAESFFGDWDQGVLRANFSSSIGPEDHDWKTRSGLFVENPEGWVANKTFVERMQKIVNEFKSNVGRMPLVEGTYKDEIRSLEKLEQMAVRLFYQVDIYTNTLARMYLMPIIMVLLRYPMISKCFGKTNSGSSQWDDLWKYLGAHRKKFDGDFVGYDNRHPLVLIRGCARLFYKVALKWYKNEEAAKICYILIYCLCCQLLIHYGDWALKFKGMPSGHIVTLILNSLINILLMLCAYRVLVGDDEFFDRIYPAVVGDDNISGVEPEVEDLFNLVTVAPLYKDWGYAVTNASKSALLEPFVSNENAQFVKRKWRFEKEIGQYVAPLETDSIYKMLSFHGLKGKETLSITSRMAACFEVAEREFFLHGREEFDRFVETFKPEVERQGLVVTWWSFDELLVKYDGGNSSDFMQWS